MPATPLKTPSSWPGHWLMGVIPEYARDRLGLFTKAAAEQGDIVRMRFGLYDTYLVNHPDYIQHVLQTNHRNYRRQKFFQDIVAVILGQGLLTADGDDWLRRRRLMQPMFHRRQVAKLGQMMTAATERAIAHWCTLPPGEPIDLHQVMHHLTLDIVGRTLFSIDLTAEAEMLAQSVAVSIAYINYRLSNFVCAPLFVPTARNRKLKRALKNMDHFVFAMIEARRQRGEQKDDLLGTLLMARDADTSASLSDRELRDELVTMIAAGHETTALALSWTFYLLAQHPEVEAQLVTEIETVLAGRLPTFEDLSQLRYTRMVLEESMRLYPPSWSLVGRDAIVEDEIGGYRIPANATVFILPYLIHRDPRFWCNPDTFDPERFSPQRSEGRHRFAYLPFGSGPRKCIGAEFAMTEAQLVLITILQMYRLTLKPGYMVQPDPIFTLQVKEGLPMVITPR